MMHLLSIVPDTRHYVKHRRHYFIQKCQGLKFITGKKFLKVLINTSWVSWCL